jgi:hypothetical protein
VILRVKIYPVLVRVVLASTGDEIVLPLRRKK